VPSPSAASENVVVYCAGHRGALSLSLYVKHQTRPPPPRHLSDSVYFRRCSQALQCTGQHVQRSAKVTQTMHAARRPTPPIMSRPLRIVRYRDMKRHDISISLLDYDMITSINKLFWCHLHFITFSLWPPCVADADIIFLSRFFLFFFYSSPNLSGRRLDVYHTSTHGAALVRI